MPALQHAFDRLGISRTSNVPEMDEENFRLQGQQARRNSLLQQADFAAGRQAPGVAQSQFRGDQRGLVNMLQNRARGIGPSVAQQQLRDSLGQNLSQQQSLLATGGPGAARAASMGASRLGGSLAGQSALLRANEISQAQGMLGQTLHGARGQDQQRQQLLSDNELRSRGLNDQQIARLRQMELDNARLGLEGSMAFDTQRTARRAQDLGNPRAGEQLIGGLTGGLTLYDKLTDDNN